MKLGVIVCPHCKMAKGINLDYRTTKCVRCGKTFHINKSKVFYKTDDCQKLRQAIGVLNEEIDRR